jgi:3',5'-cyclic AMP phosphodiesterase CpdA
MESPAIALRFRDTTPGIDTIEEHRAIRDTDGSVWWGWWKKSFEPDESEAVSAFFAKGGEAEILLLDRSTERAFRARCVGFATDPGAIDLDRVPEYYRDYVGQIAGFFRLTAIEPRDYDHKIGEIVGERTLLWLDREVPEDRSPHVAAEAKAPGKSCILHISDLHFGADYGFRVQDSAVKFGSQVKTLTECLVADLTRLGLLDQIAVVVVTGDFITRGCWDNDVRKAALKEFRMLRAALGLKQEQIVPIPGNHDIVRYPPGLVDVAQIIEWAVKAQADTEHESDYRNFANQLCGRDWEESLNYVRRFEMGDVDLLICALNSCTITATHWTEYGFVGDGGIDALRQLNREAINRPTYKIAALHHHLLPVSVVETPTLDGVTLTLDASKILGAAQCAGVQVALHGHQHKAKIAIYQDVPLMQQAGGAPIHVISNGSTGVKQDRRPDNERNAYAILRLGKERTHLWLRELRTDGEPAGELFNGPLDLKPETP